MKPIKKTSSSICPECGSDDIDYLDTETEDDYVIKSCECRKCHKEFKEYFKMTYDGYAVDNDKDETEQYDADGNISFIEPW